MQTEDNAPHKGICTKLPDELWMALARVVPGVAQGMLVTIRLFDGQIIEGLYLSGRGYLLGRIVSGMSQVDGSIDSSPLTFNVCDIEAVQVPAFHFWQRPKWITLNPRHPSRQSR